MCVCVVCVCGVCVKQFDQNSLYNVEKLFEFVIVFHNIAVLLYF